MTPSFSSGQRGADFVSAAQLRTGRILFYAGCVITLLYFPSGLLHALLGPGVYGRDVLMLIHLGASLLWLAKAGKANAFVRRTFLLLVPAVFVLPALGSTTYRVEAATFVKWGAIWLDWVVLGQLARMVLVGFEMPLRIFAGVAVFLLVVDAGAGLYESRTGTYIIHQEAEVSAFGVGETKESHLLGHLRVKGLQRDVFSYSNLMGMSMVAGLLIFLTQESIAVRVVSLGWILGFAVCLFKSGGRSAFFGVFAASAATACVLAAPVLTRRCYGIVVGVWLTIAILISCIGVGVLTESIGGSVMQGSDIGNAQSAYMRDANWKGITQAIKDLPIVLISGAPLAAVVDTKIDPIYHWADNEYLWLLYHTSIIGLLAVIVYFVNVLKLPPAPEAGWAKDCLVLFLLFVMGEAIARESMTFLGCMPLFAACGWQSAVADENDQRGGRSSSGRSAAARRTSSVRRPASAEQRPAFARPPAPAERPAPAKGSSTASSRNPARPLSEADEFARRIRQAERSQRKK
jgi:hypothetical protein